MPRGIAIMSDIRVMKGDKGLCVVTKFDTHFVACILTGVPEWGIPPAKYELAPYGQTVRDLMDAGF